MAGIGEDGLAMILEKAHRLASPQFDNYTPKSGINAGEYNIDDAVISGDFSTPNYENTNRPILGNPSKSKLPKEIMESLYNNPIDTNALDVGGLNGTSVLDSIMPKLSNNMSLKKPIQYSTPVMERQMPSQPQPIISGGVSSSVDYGVIKSLIDESVRRHLDEFKNVITESKKASNVPSMNLMRIGNKFQFVDSKGNIFEAKLEHKGNIKDKK